MQQHRDVTRGEAERFRGFVAGELLEHAQRHHVAMHVTQARHAAFELRHLERGGERFVGRGRSTGERRGLDIHVGPRTVVAPPQVARAVPDDRGEHAHRVLRTVAEARGIVARDQHLERVLDDIERVGRAHALAARDVCEPTGVATREGRDPVSTATCSGLQHASRGEVSSEADITTERQARGFPYHHGMESDGDEPYTVVRGRAESHPVDPSYDAPITGVTAYAYGDVIGKGGMGEVVNVHDRRIGRDVALKRLSAEAPTETEIERFLREARIQARLEHPAIVPVYELGKDSGGRPYFTMKRLIGRTLRELLPAEAPGSQRMLRAFAEVCSAVEFAHQRGVVHRDLKPSNVMLGDYGEVYVLDWGLARVFTDAATEVVTADLGSLDGSGEPSQLLGTPGYIAPEQLHTTGEVGRPVDVYALGSLLFEILTKQPLHPRQAQAAIASTLNATTVVSPALRFPDLGIPPELDALATGALAMDAAARPSARQLGERVQAYLDGDRDLIRRKDIARDQLARAHTALEAGQRARAMHDAGRALALDPELSGAAELVTTLVLEPPKDPPPELAAALRAADADHVRRHARTAAIAYLAIASFFPIAAWNGIRRWPEVLAVFAAALLLSGAAWAIRNKPERSFVEMLGYAIGNGILLALLGRLAGPFTFVPALTCVIIMSSMTYPAFVRRSWVLILIMVASFVVPLALEARGLLAQTWELRGGGLFSHGGALVLSGAPTLALIIGATLATVVVSGFHASAIARATQRAQLALVTQAWHLRQLLPATQR